jgi:hypothetical protein
MGTIYETLAASSAWRTAEASSFITSGFLTPTIKAALFA